MGEYFRMLRRGGAPPAAGAGAAGNLNTADSKSQNSDYGSFCNTPNCDNVTTKDGATTAATSTEPSGSGARSRSGGGTSPPRGGPAPDDDGHDDDKEEDNSMMVSGSAKTDVLTTRLRDSTFLLAVNVRLGST